MSTFLAIYHGAANDADKADISDERARGVHERLGGTTSVVRRHRLVPLRWTRRVWPWEGDDVRVSLLTCGTRGDTQPLVVLAAELRAVVTRYVSQPRRTPSTCRGPAASRRSRSAPTASS